MNRAIAALAGLALLAGPAAAPAGEGTPSPAEAALRQFLAEAAGPVRVDRHTGSSRVRTLKGKLSPPGEGPVDEVAGRFLKERAALFGLRDDAADLAPAVVRQSPAGHHLGYQQRAGELPVFNGGIEVTLDRERRVFLVNNRYAPVEGVDAKPSVTAAEAVAAARALLPAGEPKAPPQLGVFLLEERPRLAWRFVLAAREPVRVVECTIDARDRRVLQSRNLVRGVARNGTGKVFDPNPVNALDNTALVDAADADGPAFAAAYVPGVTLPSVTYKRTTARYTLRGPYVTVCDSKERPFLFPTTAGYVSSRTGNFSYVRKPNGFEHAMCYYHIDANQRYLQGLGFQDVNRRSIRVDPHGLSGADGSHYVGSPVGLGYLAFGDGGVDDAEDADVILHEYAHAIQDNQAPGKYAGEASEAGAMAEGFADYWAASATYDRSVQHGFDPACVGEWDKAPGCLSRVDGAKHYPEDLAGEAREDGEIWSAALWDLFRATGDRGATDTIVVQSHFLVPDTPTFRDGVEALIAADEALYDGAHLGQICSVMSARGIRTDGCAFSATLTWDNPLVDLDLRLRPPDAEGYAGWNYANDCFSFNPNPDWGAVGDLSDNPLMTPASCRHYCPKEQVVLGEFTTPGSYGVFVHYYDHFDWQDQTTTAELTVYQGTTEVFSGSRLLTNTWDNSPDTGDLWPAHTIEIPAP